MSGGELTYNLASTGAGIYAAYAWGGLAGIFVGTLALGGEGANASIQNLKAIQDRNRTPENTINSWDQLKRRFTDFTNWKVR